MFAFSIIQHNTNRKQQQELESKLRALESKEAELECQAQQQAQRQQEEEAEAAAAAAAEKAAAVAGLSSRMTRSGGVDSGNDHNFQSDTSAVTSPPSARRHAPDELRRVAFQQRLLQMALAQRTALG